MYNHIGTKVKSGREVDMRCNWAGDDAVMTAYHDNEWGVPMRGDGVSVSAQTPLSIEISKALKARGFKFVGPVITYAWMQAVGLVDDHAAGCFRRAVH